MTWAHLGHLFSAAACDEEMQNSLGPHMRGTQVMAGEVPGAGQEGWPRFHQGLREVSFKAIRRSLPWLLKYTDKRGRLFMSSLSANPIP